MICGKCAEDKPEVCFAFRNGKEGNRRGYCRACIKEKMREWYLANREKCLRVAAENRAANPDRVTEYWRKRYRSNPEKAKASARDWRRNNPERVKQNNVAWRKANPELAGLLKPRWAALNPEKVLARELRRTYGLTVAEFYRMLAEQGGVCAACRKPCYRKRLSVDHDHKTGAVRGLLCQRCNSALGQARENPETLRALADYIETATRAVAEAS